MLRYKKNFFKVSELKAENVFRQTRRLFFFCSDQNLYIIIKSGKTNKANGNDTFS